MAEIIELEKRRRLQEGMEADALRAEKMQLLKKVLQCARCQLRCSRCGLQIDRDSAREHSSLPYPLCSGCAAEYEIYRKRSRGEADAGGYWHNQEWIKVWDSWLQYQKSLDRYRNSREFIKLLQELEGS